jgi:hypothetical protein
VTNDAPDTEPRPPRAAPGATRVGLHGHAVLAGRRPSDGAAPQHGLERDDDRPWSAVVGERRGWGSTFHGRAGHAVWFHGAVPAPAVVGDAPHALDRLRVHLDADPGVRVEAVEVWDGLERPMYAAGGLEATSDLELRTARHGRPLPLGGGAGVSVLVRFDAAGAVTFRGLEVELVPAPEGDGA